jgi:hypothetical protein
MRKWMAWAIGLFWLGFYLAYPYRELIDDVVPRKILNNQFLTACKLPWTRLVHEGLLYLQGAFFERSMPKAMVVGLLLHLCMGAVLWKKVIPLLGEARATLAQIGLAAFMVHPVSLQTVVHVAQRSEILGSLFVVLALWMLLASPRGELTWKSIIGLGGLGLLALFTKESYLIAILGVSAVWAVEQAQGSLRRPALALPVVLCLLAVGRVLSSNPVEPQQDPVDSARRTAAFVQAYQADKPIAVEDSILFPSRAPLDNLRLQVSALPLIGRAMFVPFGLVRDYGFFPYGKHGYGWRQPWFYLGLLLLGVLGAAAIWTFQRAGLRDAVVFCLPACLYGTYWLVPLADCVVLYRLYGVVLLTLCFSLPIAFQSVPQRKLLMAALAAVIVVASLVRAYEMADAVREARLEVAREPDNYRVHIDYLHALMDSGTRPIDCRAMLEPGLSKAPSPSFIYVEWAWCLWSQGRKDEARVYAQKALEQEVVPENLHLLLDMLIGPHGEAVTVEKMHPANLRRLGVTN